MLCESEVSLLTPASEARRTSLTRCSSMSSSRGSGPKRASKLAKDIEHTTSELQGELDRNACLEHRLETLHVRGKQLEVALLHEAELGAERLAKLEAEMHGTAEEIQILMERVEFAGAEKNLMDGREQPWENGEQSEGIRNTDGPGAVLEQCRMDWSGGDSERVTLEEASRTTSSFPATPSPVSVAASPPDVSNSLPSWPAGVQGQDPILVVMTLNLQYLASFPKDMEAGVKRLLQLTSAPPVPDVICVQEGVEGLTVELFKRIGYRRLATSASQANSVGQMTYGEKSALSAIEEAHRDELLVNELFVPVGNCSQWIAVRHGVERISSELQLDDGHGRAAPLAKRSVVWAMFQHRSRPGSPSAFVLNTQLTGSRFEDQFFATQLAQERRRQPEQIIELFHYMADPGDFAVLVGDFNSTTEDEAQEPVSSYYASSVRFCSEVLACAASRGCITDDLEAEFMMYMVSPFETLRRRGWTLAYPQAYVGATSANGHLVDHMATNQRVPVHVTKLITTNQQASASSSPETDLPLSDHNGVKAAFDLGHLWCGLDIGQEPKKEQKAACATATQGPVMQPAAHCIEAVNAVKNCTVAGTDMTELHSRLR
eukprot:gnl/TRDRNA2_/TRDRNA2_152269_c0_seq1.p1 gnl/TRDRNA2_/TRDRNA2_152269_c0~~gnl/TRDRNA2_/TRDRNA2_152269_c0_seq1.p1  ORF type:complete len:602 (+),score=107.76 gnl/TRDRNA2_/TRDRNA2_152269_c0_seq1:739-2544(+)